MALLPLIGLTLCLQGPQVESLTDFESRLDKTFASSRLPGGGVRAVKDGKVLFDRAFGVADIEKKTPASTAMAFEIGSLSKQFTAVAALILVQEKKLRLEETLGEAMPELPVAWQKATIDQVLHHMSGIPDYEEIAEYDFYNLPRKPQDIFDQATKKKPDFAPGEKFYYSNTGYFIISLIIEKRSGMSIGQFLKRRLFQPLGMNSTYADEKPSSVKAMTGYHSRTGIRVAQPPIAWTSTLGAGGIVSTLDDLVKWDQALYTDNLVKKDLLAKIWTPTKFNDGKVNAYGYGWFESRFRGVRELNHSGQTNGFTCIYRRYPDQHFSVWSFTNSYGGGGVFSLARAVITRFLPEANFAVMVASKDNNASRTAGHMEAIKQAVIGKGDLALLAANMKDFATADRTVETRKTLQNILGKSETFQFLRVRQRRTPIGDEIDDYLYRQVIPNGNQYWTLGFNKGLLVSLFVEDE